MNKFSFMTPMEGRNWFINTTKLHRLWGAWDPETIHQFECNYGDSIYYNDYLYVMKSICKNYVDDTTSKDIYTLLEEGDGILPLWDYERLCAHINEEPFLLQEAGKLKYFFGKYPARILEHVDTVLNALRYRYDHGMAYYVARYREGKIHGIWNREWDYDTANAYWKKKILELWNTNEWEYVVDPYKMPYYWVGAEASYYYGADKNPETIGGYIQVYNYSWRFTPRFVSRVHIFGKTDKFNESYPPHTSEFKNDGFYPGLPENLEGDKWYKIITADFRASKHEKDYQYTEYRGVEKMPTIPDLPRYVKDINTFHTYERSCRWSKMQYVLDIRPDEPPTLEGLT